jgi:hypothetical protein
MQLVINLLIIWKQIVSLNDIIGLVWLTKTEEEENTQERLNLIKQILSN